MLLVDAIGHKKAIINQILENTSWKMLSALQQKNCDNVLSH